MKKSISILLLLSFFSCKTKFEKFKNQINDLELPYRIQCAECCKNLKKRIDSDLFNNFIEENTSIVGKIKYPNDNIGILTTYEADMVIPKLIIYSKNGKKLKAHDFMTGWCGRDFDFYQNQTLTFQKDYTIKTIDTSMSFVLDREYGEIIDTFNFKIDEKLLYLDITGELKEK